MQIDAQVLAAAALVGGGLATVAVGVFMRMQRRGETLAELLELDGGANDVPVEAVTETPASPSVSKVTARLGDVVGKLDTRGSLARVLAEAELPLRPGEYLVLSGVSALVAALLIGDIFKSFIAGLILFALVGFVAYRYPLYRARVRRDKLKAQLPDAFSLIASSVAAGHTFLRSIQLLREQIASPLAEELDRVVAEVMLGSNLIDALERFATRSRITELRWAVQAVRIQQSTGGQLAELLHTLADFMRARDEVYREVKVLTAEGRFSGWVLMALPVFVCGALLVVQRHYLAPLLRGWGFFWLGLAVCMLIAGHLSIRRLVDIEV